MIIITTFDEVREQGGIRGKANPGQALF